MRDREKIHRILVGATEYLFYAFILLMPLFFDRRLGIVFSLSKVTIMRIAIPVLIALVAARFTLGERFPARPKLLWPIATYLLLIAAATVFSIHPVVSFLGFYGRYEGLWTWLMYGGCFFFAFWIVRDMEQFKRIAMLVVIAGGVMGLYGILQRFGLDPYQWGGVDTVRFVIATIGQPNFAAAYVAMAFMFGLFFFFRREGGIPRLLSAIALFLIYVCILFTTSRGGTVGFLMGMMVFLLLMGYRRFIENWKPALALFGVLSLVTVFTMLNPDYSVVEKTISQIRVGDESPLPGSKVHFIGPAGSRVETWQSVTRSIAARPLFGVGPETLKMAFPQFENDRFRFQEGFHVKQDRAHNEVLDIAVTRGIPALLIYVWLIASFYWLIFRRYRDSQNDDFRLAMATLAAGGAAYIAQNQFSFGVVAITSLFWVILGVACSVTEEEASAISMPQSPEIPWIPLAGGGVILLLTLGISVVLYQSDLLYKAGKTGFGLRLYEFASENLTKAVLKNPFEGNYVVHLGLAHLNQWASDPNPGSYRAARAAFQYGQKVDPFNADNYYIESRMILMSDPSVSSLSEAETLAKKALAVDPYYAEVYFNLAIIAQLQKDTAQSARYYEEALLINPRLEDAYKGLQGLYRGKGKQSQYRASLSRVEEKYKDWPELHVRFAESYHVSGDIRKAIQFYEKVLQREPMNIRARIGVATLLVARGDVSEAEKLFRDILSEDPLRVEALNGLGWILEKKGNREKALEFYKQVLAIDPYNVFAKERTR